MSNKWNYFIIYFFILSLFHLNLHLFPEKKIAELEESLKRVTGKERFDVLHELSFSIYRTNPKKSIEYAKEAVEIATKLDRKVDVVRATRNIGLGYQVLGDFPSALKYNYEAFSKARKYKEKRLVAIASLSISNVYFNLCDFQKASEYNENAIKIAGEINEQPIYLAALNNQANIVKNLGQYGKALQNYFMVVKIKEKKNLRSRLGITYHNIALIYNEIEDYGMAIEFLEKALKINQEFNISRSIARNFQLMGEIFRAKGQFQKALESYKKAEAIVKKINSKPDLALILIDISKVAMELNQLDEALSLLYQAQEISKEINYTIGECSALFYHGKVLKIKQEYREALNWLLPAMEIAEKSKLKKILIDCYLNISEIFFQLEDTEKSYEYYRKHTDAKDELFNPTVSKVIRDLQLKYEKDKIEGKIQDVKKSRTWIFLLGLVLMGITAVIIYNHHRMKIKVRKLLYEKEKKLSAQENRIQALTRELKEYLKVKHRKKYQQSTLTEEQSLKYLELLLSYMEEEEPYLNPELTIKELSEEISGENPVSARDLSQVINERLQKNFNDFVNNYRIEKAKELLLRMNKNNSILDVAFDSGFNSKSSFNTLFKKYTKYTPSQYKKTFSKYHTGRTFKD